MTDKWNPSIPEHKELAHAIEFGNGIPEMRTVSKAREALKSVGFIIEHEEDLAERADYVPWYYPLEGDIRKAQTAWDYFTVWRMSWSGKLVTHNALRLMELFGFVPKGTWEVGESLKVAGDALVKGGQTKVGSCLVLCRARFPDADYFLLAVHTDVPRHQQEAQGRVKWSSSESFPLITYHWSRPAMRATYSLSYCCRYWSCSYSIFYLDLHVYCTESNGISFSRFMSFCCGFIFVALSARRRSHPLNSGE